jgi:L-aminopeptidase/D-esterase-like protein
LITQVPGVRAGHWTGDTSGVTVVLCPDGTVGAGEVRGGAPATRETALLEPGRTVERVDAVVFTGGSAFGLGTADGAMAWLAERDQGFPTTGGPVPIVPTAAIYDLRDPVGKKLEHEIPGPAEARAAADAADGGEPLATGRVGAGRGATVGKWRGPEHAVAGGLGSLSKKVDDVTLGCVVVVNAIGDVVDADGTVIAGSSAPEDAEAFPDPKPFEATTLVLLATDARLTKLECRLLAESAHDGLAMSIRPPHTRFDGDLAIAVATQAGDAEANLDRVRAAAVGLVAEAVRDPFRQT